MYKALFGMDGKPIEIFDTGTTNMLLLAAIAIGVLLIVISISVNIYLGFRSRDYERAVFGHNGIAGLVFYLAAAFAVVDMMMLHTGAVNVFYVLGLIILPLFLIFFKKPLTSVLTHRGKAV